MKIRGTWLIVFTILLIVLFQGSYGSIQITTSGGSNGESGSVSMNFDTFKTTFVNSQIAISGATVTPYAAVIGPIAKFEQTHAVKDRTGKSASVYVKVLNAPSGLTYSSKVLPKEGNVATQTQVSAEQWLTVPKANFVKCTATASYGTTRSASVGLEEYKGTVAGDYVTLKGYYGKALTTGTSVLSSQTATSGAANSIKIYGSAKDSIGTSSVNTPLKGISGGKATFAGLSETSFAGTATQVAQKEHVHGTFTSTATYTPKTGTAKTKIRTSNYGTENDLNMKAAKGSLPTGYLGYYVKPGMKIQGAVNAAALSGDTINVAAGTYKENIKIDKSLTVKGAGSTKTIVDGNKKGSVFTIGMVNPNVDVTLSGMTIQNGYAKQGGGINNFGTMTLIDSVISGNIAHSMDELGSSIGGGICNLGTATVAGSSISGNTAYWGGGGIYNCGILTVKKSSTISNNRANNGLVGADGASYGGGIFNYDSGTATVIDSAITGNTAYFDGGGIFNRGIVDVTNSEISRNTAGGEGTESGVGGGICNYNIANVKGSKISANTAYLDGGGMYNWGATLNLESSVISENHAKNNGGGIANFADDGFRAEVTVKGSTISGNIADLHGGGIWNYSPWLNGVAIVTVTDSTIGGVLPENGNSATRGDGGGIFNQGRNAGMIVRGTTIAQNHANNGGGGGIFNWGNTAVSSSDIYWNSALYGGGIANSGLLVSRDSFENQIPFVWSQVHDNINGNGWEQ